MINRLPKHGNTSCGLRVISVKSGKSRNVLDTIGTAIRGGRSVTVQATVPVIPFSPVNIIPPKLHTHLHVYVSFTGRTSRRRVGKFNVFFFFGTREVLCRKVL